jgi:hypothetical protein
VFAHPLGLLALLGVPLVLGLHLFRRRYRPKQVSALFLWVEEDDVPIAGRRREKLRSTTSLWLELLVALLLALAFAGPRGCTGDETPHLVIVLDASASMAAVTPEGTTLDAARELIRTRVEGLGKDARVTLIATGRRPRVLAGPAALAQEALNSLAAFTPGATGHTLEPALVFARELAGERGVLFVTDQHDPERDFGGIEVASVGRPADNVGIVHATRKREVGADGAVERAFVTLQAFTEDTVTRTLVVSGPRGELVRRSVRLQPERREHLAFPLPEGYPDVRVALLENDALAVDNAVDLAPEPARTLRLASTLALEEAVLLGLGVEEQPLSRVLLALPETEHAANLESAHLILGDPPPGAREAWSLRIVSGSDKGRRDLIGPFLVDRQHPLLSGTTLEGIVWSIDPEVVLPGIPLISAGDLPILTETIDGRRHSYHFNLRPSRSTLARSPDWAILLSNLIQARRAQLPGAAAVNIAVGTSFTFRGAGPGDYVAELTDGTQYVTRTAQDLLVIEDIREPGMFEVQRLKAALPRTGSGEAEKELDEQRPRGETIARFAAQFQDAAESDLRDRRSGTVLEGTARAEVPSPINPLEALACALVLLLLLANWWILKAKSRGTNLGVVL